jgi:hypothetical protein
MSDTDDLPAIRRRIAELERRQAQVQRQLNVLKSPRHYDDLFYRWFWKTERHSKMVAQLGGHRPAQNTAMLHHHVHLATVTRRPRSECTQAEVEAGLRATKQAACAVRQLVSFMALCCMRLILAMVPEQSTEPTSYDESASGGALPEDDTGPPGHIVTTSPHRPNGPPCRTTAPLSRAQSVLLAA